MYIDFNADTGLITLGYFKCTIDALISFVSVTVGFIAHYYKMSKLVDAQAATNQLKGEELTQRKQAFRSEFVQKNAPLYYNKIEAVAKTSGGKIDKLFQYMNHMIEDFRAAVGEEPSEAELAKMKDAAAALANQTTHAEKTEVKDTPNAS